MDTRPQKWKSWWIFHTSLSEKRFRFPNYYSTKCATRWIDSITQVRDGEKKCNKSRFWNYRMKMIDGDGLKLISFTNEYRNVN